MVPITDSHPRPPQTCICLLFLGGTPTHFSKISLCSGQKEKMGWGHGSEFHCQGLRTKAGHGGEGNPARGNMFSCQAPAAMTCGAHSLLVLCSLATNLLQRVPYRGLQSVRPSPDPEACWAVAHVLTPDTGRVDRIIKQGGISSMCPIYLPQAILTPPGTILVASNRNQVEVS